MLAIMTLVLTPDEATPTSNGGLFGEGLITQGVTISHKKKDFPLKFQRGPKVGVQFTPAPVPHLLKISRYTIESKQGSAIGRY
jgi:hypothetical protein